MGLALRIWAVAAVLLASAVPLAAFDGPTQTSGSAQKTTANGSGSEAKPDAAGSAATSGARMVETGIKAYEAGKAEQAIRAFDTAIRDGGLANRDMARALYYRGLAYRKHGRPGLAIADLTSAIWLKDGLSATEREEANNARTAAYRDSGIGDVPAAPQSRGSQSELVAKMAPMPVEASASTDTSASSSGWQTAMTAPTQEASASTPTPAASQPAPQPTSQPTMMVVSTPPVPPTATEPTVAKAAPSASAPAPKQPSSGSSDGIGGFFNSITSLFESGSSSDEAVTTASISGQGSAGTAVPVTGWSETTQVATERQQPAAPVQFSAPTVTRTAAVETPPAPAEPRPWTVKNAQPAVTQVAATTPPEPPKAPSAPFATEVAAAPPPAPEPAARPAPTVTRTAAVETPPAPAEPLPWTVKNAQPAVTQVAATAPPEPPKAPPPSAPFATKVAAAPPPAPEPIARPVTQPAAPPISQPAAEEEKPAAAKAASGKFRVQVASVRSRSEAYALAVRLMSQHGGELGARRPEVDEAVIGSMGTFYRVRLGPYASAQEPQELCGSLRATGFDCLVVTQ